VSETTGEQYKARHILVASEDEAKAIIQQLSSSKTDFAELAKEKSTGPSGPQGGDLGWFSSDSMVKPFSDAVMALENGKITETPVQTQFGWHVILREESKPNTPPPFAEVTERLRPRLEQDKFQAYLATQREAAKLEPAL
jgi:peptidyl-prolyl cis-trans isomerase C